MIFSKPRSGITGLVSMVLLGLLLSACETTKPEGAAAPIPAAPAVAPTSVRSPEVSIKESATPKALPGAPAQAKAAETASAPAPVAAEPPKPRPEQVFAEGKDAYQKGDFKSSVKKLQFAIEVLASASAMQREAYKLLAFSHCVTNQKSACKSAFSSLLKIEPSFVLSRSEAGHPLWGPVFKEAQAAVKVQAAKK